MPNYPAQEAAFWCFDGAHLLAIGMHAREPSQSDTGETNGFKRLARRSEFLNYWLFDSTALDTGLKFQRISSPSRTDVYFVRLNSSQKIEEVMASAAFRHQARLLSTWGLIPRAPPEQVRSLSTK